MANRVRPEYNTLKTTGVSLQPFPYIGFVKNNVDPQNMGRLSVWIPDISGDPTDESSWIICSYCSPFAGASNITQLANYQSNQAVSQQSYGWVSVPPDLNNEVMVIFVGGQLSRAYWIGCTYQQNMNNMVPGIPGDPTTLPGTPPPVAPTIEYNKATTSNPGNPLRPPFQPLTDGLNTQGFTTPIGNLNSIGWDLERGLSTTSMRRESPPLVYGLLTPRGNTMHIDDNSSNEFIRLRTRSGAQVLIHETTGYVYINSKNGDSWFEISDSGIDGYTAHSISLRAQMDVNIRADKNINLDAGGNIFMNAGGLITMNAGSNIQANATANLVLSAAASSLAVTNDYQVVVGGNIKLQTTANTSILSGGSINLQSTSDTTMLSGANIRLQSATDTSSLAGGDWYRTAGTIYDNSTPAPAAAAAAIPVAKPAVVPATTGMLDTAQTLINGTTWAWKHGAAMTNTIVPRMPTHEPWYEHPRSTVPGIPSERTNNDGSPDNITPIVDGGSNGGGNTSNTMPDGTLNDAGCAFGTANTQACSTDVYNAITAAAAKTGANLATMLAFADMESSFRPGVGASTSSAKGLYQFIDSTWTSMVKTYGNRYNIPNITNAVYDPNYNALMGGQLIQDITKSLQSQGIQTPTPGQVYACHFMGTSGGSKLIAASQNTPTASAASLFPSSASANKSIFYNSDGSARTVSQVNSVIASKADSKATAYAAQLGLPAPCTRGTGVAGNSPSSPAAPAAGATAIPAAASVAPNGYNSPIPNTNPNTSPSTPTTTAFSQYVGRVIGTGQCVALVQAICKLPNTKQWQAGASIINNYPPVGTPIAAFDPNGTYGNHVDGTSHAAIFCGPSTAGNGIQVFDQWSGQPAHFRNITFDNRKTAVNNANNYRVINLPTPLATTTTT